MSFSAREKASLKALQKKKDVAYAFMTKLTKIVDNLDGRMSEICCDKYGPNFENVDTQDVNIVAEIMSEFTCLDNYVEDNECEGGCKECWIKYLKAKTSVS